jgi:hypothetical protein
MRYSTFIGKLQTKTWYGAILFSAKNSVAHQANNPAQIAERLAAVLNEVSDAVGSKEKSIAVHRGTITRIRDGVLPTTFKKALGNVEKRRKYDLVELIEKAYPQTKEVFNSPLWEILKANPLDKTKNLEIQNKLFSKYSVFKSHGKIEYCNELVGSISDKSKILIRRHSDINISQGFRATTGKTLEAIDDRATNPFDVLAILGVIYRDAWHAMDRYGVQTYIDWIERYLNYLSGMQWLKDSTFDDLTNAYINRVVDAKENSNFNIELDSKTGGSEQFFLYGLKDVGTSKNQHESDLKKRFFDAIEY